MAKRKPEPSQCTHYWIIESPDGRTSIGQCKYCGLVNEFSNDWHDALNNNNKEYSERKEESLV